MLLKVKVILLPLFRTTEISRHSKFSNISFKATVVIEAIFRIEPPLVRGTKV